MKRLFLLLSCLLVVALAGNGWAGVWYVKPDGSDFNDGQSWLTAFQTIQNAVNSASDDPAAPDEIWVAAGTYLLEETYLHRDYILIDKVVSLYGGFSGTETNRDERDWVNNVTTVDGNNTVLCFYMIADGTIDGFTIAHGNDYYYAYGGGIRIDRCSPTIANCKFQENAGKYYGGGIYNYFEASPTIVNCSFFGNTAAYLGGAIYNYYYSSPTITNCTFHGNSAGRNGGAVVNYYYSSPAITNCTFYANSADYDGGAIWNYYYAAPIITNCILWGDTAQNGPEIFSGVESYPDIAYSDIQGGYSGLGEVLEIIDQDPVFVDPDNGDFHLQAGSPCIDAGTDDVLTLASTDFEGDPRILGTMPDMGVDEFVPPEDPNGGLASFALYANKNVRLRGIADSRGNVGSNGWIRIARPRSGTVEGDLCAVKGIRVTGSIKIDGDVKTNGKVRVRGGRRWHGKLRVTGSITEGEAAELSPMDLPALDFSAGSPDIRVRKNRSLTLDPASYGKVRVGRGATLHLSSGNYSMERLVLHRRATLSIDLSEGPVTINVVKRLRFAHRGEVDVVSGTTSGVTINVLQNRCVWIGPYVTVRGTLVAPNSMVWFGYRSKLEGAVYADRISVGPRASFQFHEE
jgi:cytoskeletal protein CcmA (bactofilin family)